MTPTPPTPPPAAPSSRLVPAVAVAVVLAIAGAGALSRSSAPAPKPHRAIVISDPAARKAFDAIKDPTPAQERMFEDSNDLNTPATP